MKKALGILIILMLVAIVTTIANPQFAESGNLENLIYRTALFGVISIGVSFVIVTGGIDLSIGSVIALTGCLLPLFLTSHYEPLAAKQTVVSVDATAKQVVLPVNSPAMYRDDRLLFQVERPGAIARDRRYNVAEASRQEAHGVVVRVQELPQDLNVGMTVVIEKNRHMNVAVAIFLVLAVCVAIGLTHGLLITKLNLPPFVVTLCGLLFYRGLARFITNDNSVGFGSLFGGLRAFESSKAFHLPLPFLRLISGEAGDTPLATAWLGIHMRVVFLALLAVAATVVMNYSVFGRYLKALGRNAEAARLSGINTDRMIIAAYVICAVLSGVAGILFVLEFNNVAPNSSGGFFELWAISAAVLGGCSLRGGEAPIAGVIVGAAIGEVLSNAITLNERIPQSTEYCVKAVTILAGVIIDELLRRFAARRRARREAVQAERESVAKKPP
jgi:ribose transport system permease protein